MVQDMLMILKMFLIYFIAAFLLLPNQNQLILHGHLDQKLYFMILNLYK